MSTIINKIIFVILITCTTVFGVLQSAQPSKAPTMHDKVEAIIQDPWFTAYGALVGLAMSTTVAIMTLMREAPTYSPELIGLITALGGVLA